MEAIMKESTYKQWTGTQLRRNTNSRADNSYNTQESVAATLSSPYVSASELHMPPQDLEQAPDDVPDPQVPSEPSNGSHYLTILPPDTTGSDTEEELPDISPTTAFATEFMKNFDPIQIDLMIQILISALTCSANRPRRKRSDSCPHPASQQDTAQQHLSVPEKEDRVSCYNDEFEGPYHRLADMWLSLKDLETGLSSAENTQSPSSEKPEHKCDLKKENPLFCTIGDLLLDQPSTQDNTDLSPTHQVSQQPQNILGRQNAVRYKDPPKRKSPTHASRSRTSSEPATNELPPPLPPRTFKKNQENPKVAVSKLRMFECIVI